MEKGFTEKEKDFFKRHRTNDSLLKTVFIIAGFILFFGILLDAFSGFSILRNSKSIFHGVLGLAVITIIYFLAEGLSTKINSKDKVSHPLYKRLFHLFLLIVVAVGLIVVGYWVLNLINQ
ncbi:hypothetical protein KQH27_00495 [bacterium]|nr:hypothetical protein [bacterium]